METMLAHLQDGSAGEAAKAVGKFLASYAGISAGAMFVVGALKRLFRPWTKGKEPFIVLGATLALGVAGMLAGFYGDPNDPVAWVVHGVMLLGAAAGAGVAHDKVLNPLLGKDDPSVPPGGTKP